MDTGGRAQADRGPRGDGRGWVPFGSQQPAGFTAVGPASAGPTPVEAASAVPASKPGVTLPRERRGRFVNRATLPVTGAPALVIDDTLGGAW